MACKQETDNFGVWPREWNAVFFFWLAGWVFEVGDDAVRVYPDCSSFPTQYCTVLLLPIPQQQAIDNIS